MSHHKRIPLIRANTDPELWQVAWSIAMPHMPDDGRAILSVKEGSNAGFRISLLVNRRKLGMNIRPTRCPGDGQKDP